MLYPSVLTYQGRQTRLPTKVSLTMPPSKSELIRRIFIQAIQGKAGQSILLDSTWPQDVKDAWSLVQSYESKRQTGQHAAEDFVWEAGEAGTVMRFGLAFLVAQGCEGILKGSGRAHKRPIGDLVGALLTCGAKIEYLERDGFPPLRIRSSLLSKKDLVLDADMSSQFISAMVLVAPLLHDESTSKEPAPWVISWPSHQVSSRPYLELTIKEMISAGYDMEWNGDSIRYLPAGHFRSRVVSSQGESIPSVGAITRRDFGASVALNQVEGDWSAVSFWIWRQSVIPLCHRLKICFLNSESVQADRIIMDLLPLLAPQTTCCIDPAECSLIWETHGLNKIIRTTEAIERLGAGHSIASKEQGIWRIRATDFPDMVPSLVMWAVLSGNPLDILGIGHLRFKESDRIRALSFNLNLLGILHENLDRDGLAIRPLCSWKAHSRQFVAGQTSLSDSEYRPIPMLRCFGDHRMAMAFSMLVLPDLSIPLDDPEVVRKSYPGFWKDWAKFGYALQSLN